MQKQILKRNPGESDNQYFARLAEEVRKIYPLDTKKTPKEYCTSDQLGFIKAVNDIILSSPKLVRFIEAYCSVTFPTYMAKPEDKEDLIQEAWQEVVRNIRRYNGTCDITTFAKLHVKHGVIAGFVAKKQELGAYQNETLNKVRKAKSMLINEGYEETEITISLINEKMPSLTQRQIQNALRDDTYGQRVMFNPNYEKVNFSTPESEYERNEHVQLLKDVLSQVPEIDKVLLIELAGEGKFPSLETSTYKQPLCEVLGKEPGFVKLIRKYGYNHLVDFDDDGNEYVSKDHVRMLFEKAKRNVKSVPIVSNYTANKIRNISKKIGGDIISLNNHKYSAEDERILFECEDDFGSAIDFFEFTDIDEVKKA